MKRFMFFSIGVLCLAIAVVLFAAYSISAQLPPVGYIGLFKDATHNTDPAANTLCPGPYGEFHCWIWAVPSARGLKTAEFAVLFPPSITNLGIARNPGIITELGTLWTGIKVEFGSCQMDWLWIFDLKLFVMSPVPIVQQIDIIPHPGTLPLPAIQFANCGMVLEPSVYLTPLYLCWFPDPGPLGVQETNWGAIKALYK